VSRTHLLPTLVLAVGLLPAAASAAPVILTGENVEPEQALELA